MSEYLSFQRTLDLNASSFVSQMQKVFLDLKLACPQPFILFLKTQNEKKMVVKSKWGQCLVTDLIYILRLNTFVLFMVFLCCSFFF